MHPVIITMFFFVIEPTVIAMFYLVIAFICQAVTDRYYLVIDPFNVLEVALEEV